MASQGWMRTALLALLTVAGAGAFAQIPDLLNALDAGGRSMGAGGATGVTDANTLSTYHNPAGLAFVQSPTFSMSVRNVPESSSRIGGNFNDPLMDTDEFVGARRLSHLGYAMPIKGGTLGFSYTLGGAIRDDRIGNNLINGLTSIRNYQELIQSQVDFFTVAYGKRSGSSNFGVGIVMANRYMKNQQSYQIFDAGNNNIGNVNTDVAGNGTGVGAIIGIQSNAGNGNTMVGASIRTPIKVNGGPKGFFDTIPGRASLGVAQRTLGHGDDFLVYGLQADWFFGGDKGGILPRKDVLALGGGAEYNFHRWNARFPVRLGYQSVPSGGNAFTSRNAFTFGFGYRPNESDFALDLNFAVPSNGGRMDTGLGVTYRLSK